MDTIQPGNNDDEETERRMRLDAEKPPMAQGLTRKQKTLIVGVGLGALLLLALLFLLLSGEGSGKSTKAVPAVNRGLMQAEAIRQQKDQLDAKGYRRSAEEEAWAKRFQAMRDRPEPDPSPARMPDPVPMFPQGSPPVEGVGEVQPGKPEEAGRGWKPPTAAPGPATAPNEPVAPEGFKTPQGLEVRMSEEYQRALAFNASEQLVFTRERAREERKETPGGKGVVKPERPMGKVVISAGQELTAVLNETLDSDYPSVAKATMTSPAELVGTTLLLSYSLGNERVTAQVMKLILPPKEGERAREQPLAAVVKNGLPGLAGDVNHHWTAQVTSGIASAGLTAGALAYAAQNSNSDLGTAVLVAPLIEQGVKGVLKPIDYLGRDRPVTVTVPAGTEFTLLVTEGFEVEL